MIIEFENIGVLKEGSLASLIISLFRSDLPLPLHTLLLNILIWGSGVIISKKGGSLDDYTRTPSLLHIQFKNGYWVNKKHRGSEIRVKPNYVRQPDCLVGEALRGVYNTTLTLWGCQDDHCN